MVKILMISAVYTVLALAFVASIFAGKRNGFRLGLLKFFLSLVSGVGCYFATPKTAMWAEKIMTKFCTERAMELVNSHQAIFNACTFFVLFVVFMLIAKIICAVVKHAMIYKKKKVVIANKAKKAKVTGVNKQIERKRAKRAHEAEVAEKKEQKAEFKAAFKFRHKFFGAILGFLTCCVMVIVAFLPVGYLVKTSKLAKYEYTFVQPFKMLEDKFNVYGFLAEKEKLDLSMFEKAEEEVEEEFTEEEVETETEEETTVETVEEETETA